MMGAPFDLISFVAGFICCVLIVGLYQLSKVIDILREFITILKEELRDD